MGRKTRGGGGEKGQGRLTYVFPMAQHVLREAGLQEEVRKTAYKTKIQQIYYQILYTYLMHPDNGARRLFGNPEVLLHSGLGSIQ